FEQRAVTRGGFQEVEDVILPADADDRTIKLALDKYKKASEGGQKDDAALTKIEKDHRAARIEVLDREIAELQQEEEESKKARELLNRYGFVQIVTNISEYGSESQQTVTGEKEQIEYLERTVTGLNNEIEHQRELLSEARGWTKRGLRRELETEIGKLDYRVGVLSQSLKVARMVAGAKEYIKKHGNEHDISSKLWPLLQEKDRLEKAY
ncbi:MAG TPA: hypothetical protein PK263_03465, partial [bacterium]|nr:hypothetical protein [bacterium]